MFRSIILSIAIIFITFNGIKCTKICKESEKKCSDFHELEEDIKIFTEWGPKQCPTNTTVLDKHVVDDYKRCIKEHLEPCVNGTSTLRKLFCEMFDKFDLCHVCGNQEQHKIKEHMEGIIKQHGEELTKEGDKKCSIIREAMVQVKICAKIQ